MRKIVITFGRMNPPTVGHQKLVQKIQSVAKANNADSRIYLSHTQNNKKDPLTYDEKIGLARAAFGNIVVKSNAKTIIEVSKELDKAGYTDLILVVGSDRIADFDTLLNKYNGKEYKFDSIKVVSAGERDPDAEGVEGMSASKLRKLAQAGDYETFSTGLPSKVSDKMKKQTYDKIRSVIKEENETDYCFECKEDPCACDGMQIGEDRKPLTIQQRMQRSRTLKRLQPKLQRFKKMRAKRMADEPRLKKKAQKAAIAVMRKKVAGERGKDYANLPASDKIAIDRLISKKSSMIQKLAKRLLPAIRKKELARVKQARSSTNEVYEVAQDKTIGDKPGTQPKKYYSGLSKSEKETRNAQFKSGAEKDSSDPSAYPDKHAGDAGVKTKQSKHTKKYKDMFGEKTEVSKAREAIQAEKESDKKKFDSLLDRARSTDSRRKNMKSTVEEFEINESAEASLRKKADKSGISYGTLKKVYDRGMAAWRTGHRPGATQQQWAFARVNSYITKGKGTYHGADKDLREEVEGMAEETIHVGYRNSRGVWIKTSTHSNYPDADKAMKELEKSGKKGVQHRYDNKGNIDPGMRKLAHEEVEGVAEGLEQDYQVGEKVLTQVGGKWIPATITKPINAAGNYGVRFKVGAKVVNYVSSSDQLKKQGIAEAEKNPHTSALGKALYRDLSKEKKASPQQVQRNKERWAKRQAEREQGVAEGFGDAVKGIKRKVVHKEEGGAGEWGTTKLTKKLKKDTPMEDAGSMKHHQFQNTFKHARQHAMKHIDKDVDGDVDNLDDNPYVPDEITGTEKKDLTSKMFSKFRKEKQHTKKGDAFEEVVIEETETCCDDCDKYFDHIVEEAEHQGRKVKLNDPFRTPSGPKKFSVYVKNDKGNVVKVNFGDPNMEIKRDDPDRRKNFRARHNCENPGPKWKARYWSCHQWRSGAKVDS